MWSRILFKVCNIHADNEGSAEASLLSRVDRGEITVSELGRTSNELFGVQWADIDLLEKAAEKSITLPTRVIQEWRLLPIGEHSDSARFLLCDRIGLRSLAEAEADLAKPVEGYLIWTEHWEHQLHQVLSQKRGDRPHLFVAEEAPKLKDGRIQMLLNGLLEMSEKHEASDVHLDATSTGYKIRMRIGGVLKPMGVLSRELGQSLAQSTKVRAGIALDKHMKPADGVLRTSDEHRLRLATISGQWGVSLVLRWPNRLAERTGPIELGMSPEMLATIETRMSGKEGLCIISGSTGSGKTSTAYGLLKRLGKGMRIITMEDPVEYEYPEWTQIELNTSGGMEEANVLRAILRQAPDVLLVGEMRDADTAKLALKAAMSGHRIYTTVHAPHPLGVVVRLLEMGVPRLTLANALRVVLHQKLLPRMCSSCGRVQSDNNRENSCITCNKSKETGRTGVFSLWIPSTNWLEALANEMPLVDLWQLARQDGASSFYPHKPD